MGSSESTTRMNKKVIIQTDQSSTDHESILLHQQPIAVNSLTESPQQLYKELSESQEWKANYRTLTNMAAGTPKLDDHVRFVCISDTHNRHGKLALPDGDILLHAGDFTWEGKAEEVESFCNFLSSVSNKYKHIIVIAGNHELTFDNLKAALFGLIRRKSDVDIGPGLKDRLKKHCIYLEDEEVEVMGFKIYGSPWYV